MDEPTDGPSIFDPLTFWKTPNMTLEIPGYYYGQPSPLIACVLTKN